MTMSYYRPPVQYQSYQPPTQYYQPPMQYYQPATQSYQPPVQYQSYQPPVQYQSYQPPVQLSPSRISLLLNIISHPCNTISQLPSHTISHLLSTTTISLLLRCTRINRKRTGSSNRSVGVLSYAFHLLFPKLSGRIRVCGHQGVHTKIDGHTRFNDICAYPYMRHATIMSCESI